MPYAMLPLLARGSDDLSGILNFCIFAAIIAVIVFAQVLKKVSPDAMAKRIRELQEAKRAGGYGGGAPFVKPLPAPYATPMQAIPVAQLAPVKKKRKKKAHATPAAPIAGVAALGAGASTALGAGLPALQQAVVLSEVLGPPLVLRARGFAGRHAALATSPRVRPTGALAR